MIFLEIKKKYRGIVYKRRVAMSLNDIHNYIDFGKKPFNSQIMNEIDYLSFTRFGYADCTVIKYK